MYLHIEATKVQPGDELSIAGRKEAFHVLQVKQLPHDGPVILHGANTAAGTKRKPLWFSPNVVLPIWREDVALKVGDKVRIKRKNDLGETTWEITYMASDGLGCMIREAGTTYSPQVFDTSLLVRA